MLGPGALWCGADSIHDAARAGNLAEVQRQVKESPFLRKALDGSGRTPANVAAAAGRIPVVEFLIEDKGSGMSEQTLQHVFEAFYSTKPEGMGIGLNLCRSIVESHHGRLQAQNIYNEAETEVCGCRFTFWIPVPAATDKSN